MMSYKLKTLIVFDTNSLRSTEAGEVAYSFFAFGKPFQVIEEFIKDKNLSNDIHIAIPSWAIEELKDQKQIRYKEDIIEFKKLAKRLSGLPHVPEINVFEEGFDCTAYVNEKAIAFIATKDIKLLEIKEEIGNTVLRSMMSRVMKEEKHKTPFVHAKKGNKTYKDAGFKDNLIWESLMHFDQIPIYDKIILVTGDSDFNFSSHEFEEKWKRHISILKDENAVLTEIQIDFKEYLEFRDIDTFARTEYFIGKLNEELSKCKTVYPTGIIMEIIIKDPCISIQAIPPTEDIPESLMITSGITVKYIDEDKIETLKTSISTVLSDRENKEIIDILIDQRLQ
jgi:hypothetical protein